MRHVPNIKLFKTGILTGALFILMLPAAAQTDTVNLPEAQDTAISIHAPVQTKTEIYSKRDSDPDTNKVKRSHSTRVATISSMILPGLGQAYNGKYYKVPVIYGAGAIIYYFYDTYNYEYQRYKKAQTQIKGNQEVTDPELKKVTENEINFYVSEYRRRRDYQVIFMGLLYTANIVDALVDSYMYEFDVSKDLTMKVGPTILPSVNNEYASCGIRLSMRF